MWIDALRHIYFVSWHLSPKNLAPGRLEEKCRRRDQVAGYSDVGGGLLGKVLRGWSAVSAGWGEKGAGKLDVRNNVLFRVLGLIK